MLTLLQPNIIIAIKIDKIALTCLLRKIAHFSYKAHNIIIRLCVVVSGIDYLVISADHLVKYGCLSWGSHFGGLLHFFLGNLCHREFVDIFNVQVLYLRLVELTMHRN